MTDDKKPDETPVYVGRMYGQVVRLHFRQAGGFEDLTEQRARRLAFDLADVLGLKIYDPALLGEVAE
ncbi:hypothetical protein EYS09_27025 [Streptomyces kasugaensis]|uniref:Uncharacterized protein n=1 Tax=Streptomyces kasugaensis TaxID=1946 RepID=A0A4Q9HP28_STRKA|nr:hypothetical protein [Streptomyces kasugaensis]TBO56622.1 hypothetical protein EYS09_27025 [Streptomyces kasugaensis]